jgi:hypothetical protein
MPNLKRLRGHLKLGDFIEKAYEEGRKLYFSGATARKLRRTSRHKDAASIASMTQGEDE